MANKPNFRQVIDSNTGVTFAVIVHHGDKIRAHGSMKQGRDWAAWANDSRLSYEELVSSLDPGLEVGPSMELTNENLSLVSDSITPSTMRDLSAMVPVVVAIVQTKSEPNPTQHEEAPQDDEPEFELLENWPMTDVALSLFDVQLKRLVLDFKAKSFLSKKDYASLATKVKASKASFVDGSWVPRPTVLDDKTKYFGSVGRRHAMRLYSDLDNRGFFAKMAPIGSSRFNTNPMTARDADKDRLVLEGVPWINMGRGIPDPTPFGNTSPDLAGIRAFGGKYSAIGNSANRRVRRTRRAMETARAAARRTIADELSWLADGASDPTASMAGRLRRRLADYKPTSVIRSVVNRTSRNKPKMSSPVDKEGGEAKPKLPFVLRPRRRLPRLQPKPRACVKWSERTRSNLPSYRRLRRDWNRHKRQCPPSAPPPCLERKEAVRRDRTVRAWQNGSPRESDGFPRESTQRRRLNRHPRCLFRRVDQSGESVNSERDSCQEMNPP